MSLESVLNVMHKKTAEVSYKQIYDYMEKSTVARSL